MENYEKIDLQVPREQERQRIEKLKKENKELKEEMRCRNCKVRNRVMLNKSCGHIEFCRECASQMENENRKKCNMCNQPIQGFKQVYLG